jgi:antitoxin component YwqK of YwqJK toxin-antitoxin module
MWLTAALSRGVQLAPLLPVGAALWLAQAPIGAAETEVIQVTAANCTLGTNHSVRAGAKEILLSLQAAELPFAQRSVIQTTSQALQGPASSTPHFVVRFALPIPPDNDTNLTGALLGVDAGVWAHNHSPGFEVMPNGDLLAVYFSAKDSRGESECDRGTRFVQARLRCGAEEWDMPEVFLDFQGMNDQSALLWRDGSTIRFFGGGRESSPWMPFKMAWSTNNGAAWVLSLPLLDKAASNYTAQPIASMFRGADGALSFAMDGADDSSFLWQSADGGAHWRDMGGRTGARHSAILPLDDRGHLLSIGGKNGGLNGWSPVSTSSDSGASWEPAKPSALPALSRNQRPCMIRLANGHLCIVTDSYASKTGKSPPGWAYGEGCVVGISANNGASWHFKRLPVELPHERDRKHGTLGYATARQAPNGVIHVLATMTHPCLHYEFNEAWVFSGAGDITPEARGGQVQQFRENYADGKPRITWAARICPNGRYLLDGPEVSYYPDGRKEHEVTYDCGRKTGAETLWNEDGAKLWAWEHNPNKHTSVWTHFWPNGQKRIESTWNTNPKARDLARRFTGLVADGPVKHWDANGKLLKTYRFKSGVLVEEAAAKLKP